MEGHTVTDRIELTMIGGIAFLIFINIIISWGF
jgi:hypothetical protein